MGKAVGAVSRSFRARCQACNTIVSLFRYVFSSPDFSRHREICHDFKGNPLRITGPWRHVARVAHGWDAVSYTLFGMTSGTLRDMTQLFWDALQKARISHRVSECNVVLITNVDN
jgi:hypothetical protein